MQENWKIKLLYDGECPLCVKEVNFLLKKDAGRELIKFIDISEETYNPAEHQNIDYETDMGRIHGILANGEIIKNVAVFRQIYEILGMGWVYKITKIPLIGNIADGVYGIWADYRLQITGRPKLEILVKQRTTQGKCRISLTEKKNNCQLSPVNYQLIKSHIQVKLDNCVKKTLPNKLSKK